MQIYQLPQLTSIGAAAVVPVESGTTTYKATVGDLTGFDTLLTLPNTQDITVSVDALGNSARHYTGILSSYGAQSTTGTPENASYYVEVYVNNANYKRITIHNMGTTGTIWQKNKTSGTWGKWMLVSGKLTGTVTRGSMMNVSDTIALTAAGSVGIIRIACRINAGTYGNTDYLFTTAFKPSVVQSALVAVGSDVRVIAINASGVYLNSTITLTGTQWIIGQITFPIGDWGV